MKAGVEQVTLNMNFLQEHIKGEKSLSVNVNIPLAAPTVNLADTSSSNTYVAGFNTAILSPTIVGALAIGI